MNDQEINDYLKDIADNKIELEGVEKEIANEFRNTGSRIKILTDELKKIDESAKRIKERFLTLKIKMDTYTEILLLSEAERRKKLKNE